MDFYTSPLPPKADLRRLRSTLETLYAQYAAACKKRKETPVPCKELEAPTAFWDFVGRTYSQVGWVVPSSWARLANPKLGKRAHASACTEALNLFPRGRCDTAYITHGTHTTLCHALPVQLVSEDVEEQARSASEWKGTQEKDWRKAFLETYQATAYAPEAFMALCEENWPDISPYAWERCKKELLKTHIEIDRSFYGITANVRTQFEALAFYEALRLQDRHVNDVGTKRARPS